MPSPSSVRVDSWLWAVRATKTRSQATTACRAGHVRVGDNRVKAAHVVRVGDTVRIRANGFDRILEVTDLISKRVGAEAAGRCYIDHTPPPLAAENMPAVPRRDRGTGRPTKRERRELEKLRGRDDGMFDTSDA